MNTPPVNETVQTMYELPSRKKRFQFFFIAYMVGVIIVTGIIVLRLVLSESDIGMGLFETIFRFFLIATFGLPMGLLLALEWVLKNSFGLDITFIGGSEGSPAETTFQSISQYLPYLLLLGISITGVLTKHRQTFRVLYCVFIGILIIAIGGCMRLK
jgi:hypothetical protein